MKDSTLAEHMDQATEGAIGAVREHLRERTEGDSA
jgi:hypothetical protein